MKVEVKNDLDSGPVFVEIHCTDITDEVNKLERYIKRYKAAIPATADGERVNLAVEAILYIESVDKRTFIYTENRVLMTEKRLYELEEVLDKRDFFRCSKSTIIHLNKIVKLKPEFTRNILATLSNGENIVISRRYAAELKKLLGIGN
ncbi:MAG: LytTR family transcriptional regulator DNA-binding domain-containing protein [Lachnospiraceae bacterium]|nr:LytTR family transcriptional regulator DNA-binding domain-containing protein [Lachnospiraceae bacterium]